MMIKKIEAVYGGPDIIIGNKIDKDYVFLRAIFDNGLVMLIDKSLWYLNETTVQYKGPNMFFATYGDMLTSFTVNGISSFTNLYADRTLQDRFDNGESFESGTEINNNHLNVYLKDVNNDIRKLLDTEYLITKNKPLYNGFTTYYESENGITKKYSDVDTLSHITILHKDKYDFIETDIKIPVRTKFKDIITWYEGFRLKDINDFYPNDVIIYMETHSGHMVRIPCDFPNIKIDIEEIDDKHAKISTYYHGGQEAGELESYIIVPLKKEIPYTSTAEFTVLHREDKYSNDMGDVDITRYFIPRLSVGNVVFVNWKIFTDTCDDYGRYGTFIVTAPKGTGLDNRFDSVWKVICDGKTLIATVIEIYDEQ